MERSESESVVTREPGKSINPAATDRVEPPTTEYSRSDRRLDTGEELPSKVRLRSEHAGQWVAWSADRQTIVASAERLLDLDDAILKAGITGALYEWVEPIQVRNLNR